MEGERKHKRYDVVSRDGAILKEDTSKSGAKDFISRSGLTGLRVTFSHRATPPKEIDVEMQQCIEDTQKALDVIMYRIGERPPNYPVPAPNDLRTFLGEYCIHLCREFFRCE